MTKRQLEFKITEDHMKLLKRFNVSWDCCEYGAPSIDCKRPYGNSDAEADICDILGWEYDEDEGPTDEQRVKAEKLHKEMEAVLQIVVANCQDITGDYSREQTWYKWSKANV